MSKIIPSFKPSINTETPFGTLEQDSRAKTIIKRYENIKKQADEKLSILYELISKEPKVSISTNNSLDETLQILTPGLCEDSKDTNILPYLNYLEKISSYNECTVDAICEIWVKMIEKNISIREISDDNASWIYGGDEYICPCEYLGPIFAKYEDRLYETRTKYVPIVRVLRRFEKYGVNYIPTILLLLKDLKQLKISVNFSESEIKGHFGNLNSKFKIQKDIEMMGIDKVSSLYEFGNFSFVGDKMSRYILEKMMEAVNDIDGTEEWFKTDGQLFSKSSISEEFRKHPSIQECELSGCSMSWTLAVFRNIYSLGWENWVKDYISS